MGGWTSWPTHPPDRGLIIKLCENTKNYKYAYPRSNKVVYGACEQESEEKNQNLDIWICKIRLL